MGRPESKISLFCPLFLLHRCVPKNLRVLSVAYAACIVSLIARGVRNLTKVEKIDVSGCKLDTGAAQLIASITESSTTLHTVIVNDCHLNTELGTDITKALCTSPKLPIVHLGLARNDVGSNHGKTLQTAFMRSGNLRSLDLSGVKLSDE